MVNMIINSLATVIFFYVTLTLVILEYYALAGMHLFAWSVYLLLWFREMDKPKVRTRTIKRTNDKKQTGGNR